MSRQNLFSRNTPSILLDQIQNLLPSSYQAVAHSKAQRRASTVIKASNHERSSEQRSRDSLADAFLFQPSFVALPSVMLFHQLSPLRHKPRSPPISPAPLLLEAEPTVARKQGQKPMATSQTMTIVEGGGGVCAVMGRCGCGGMVVTPALLCCGWERKQEGGVGAMKYAFW